VLLKLSANNLCCCVQVAMVKDLSVAVLQAEKRKRAFGTKRRATDFEKGATYSEVVKVRREDVH